MPERRIAEGLARLASAALLGTAALYVLTIAIGQFSAWGIHGAAMRVSDRGVPSVTDLAGARSELRHLEVLLDDVADEWRDGGPTDTNLRLGEGARDRLLQAWQRYNGLPVLPRAEAARRELAPAVAAVASAANGVLRASSQAQARQAVQRARVAADGLDERLRTLQQLHADAVAGLAGYIDHTWRRVLVLSATLGALSLAMTVVATVLTRRLWRAHTSLLERRAEQLGLFASRIAHDVANPLAALSMTLSLLGEAEDLPPRTAGSLERARGMVRRLVELIDGLYKYAQAGGAPEPSARAEVDRSIEAVVDQVQPLVDAAHAHLTVDPLPSVAVPCSPGVLISMVQNLVGNAVKHASGDRPADVRVRVEERDREVRIEVCDNGPGIAPELQAQLFEPFKRGSTSTPGLGLGLATVKRLAESHGGRVGVASTPGHGSTFWICLPRAGEPAAARP